MENVSINCDQCGAILVIGAKTHFVTCLECRARLEVKRSATAIYTAPVDDVRSLKKELARLDEAVTSARPERPRPNSETILRLIMGGILIASDVYWFITDPTMQSLYVRIMILAAGVWLVLSGVVKTIAAARESVRHIGEKKRVLEERREAVASTIAKLDAPDAPAERAAGD